MVRTKDLTISGIVTYIGLDLEGEGRESGVSGKEGRKRNGRRKEEGIEE